MHIDVCPEAQITVQGGKTSRRVELTKQAVALMTRIANKHRNRSLVVQFRAANSIDFCSSSCSVYFSKSEFKFFSLIFLRSNLAKVSSFLNSSSG